MNQLTGFAALLFAALLLIVSSVTNVKVIAQGNDNSSEKSTTAGKTCSPEVFKENPGLYATCVALAHNKESAASAEKPAAEKPVENLNLFNSHSPIEVKKLTEEKKTSAGECPSGKVKDWAGICFKESEAKACPTCAPGSAASAENPNTSPPAENPVEYKIKKPASPANPTWLSQDCHRTASGKLLCLTTPASPHGGAYETGVNKLVAEVAENPKREKFSEFAACASFTFNGNDWKQCQAGYRQAMVDWVNKNFENYMKNCPAGTKKNAIGSVYRSCRGPL